MNTFNLVILVIFVFQLSAQFVKAIDSDCGGLMVWFGIEVMIFGYLAKFLFIA